VCASGGRGKGEKQQWNGDEDRGAVRYPRLLGAKDARLLGRGLGLGLWRLARVGLLGTGVEQPLTLGHSLFVISVRDACRGHRMQRENNEVK